jgi:hypothetical protein
LEHAVADVAAPDAAEILHRPRAISVVMASAPKGRLNAHHHLKDIIAEFSDLVGKASRVAHLNALILNRVVLPFDTREDYLETALLQIERGTMDEIIATLRKMAKAHCERPTVLLKRL